MLKQGRVVDRGSPAELLAKYGRDDMEQVFIDIARGRPRGDQAGEQGAGQQVPA
jgi:ABC-2 type transport system ATP-binding protein